MLSPSTRLLAIAIAVILAASVSACSSTQPGGEPAQATDQTPEPSQSVGAAAAAGTLDLTAFFEGALTEEPIATSCTLSDGSETSCYELTVAGFPVNRDTIGPWCPPTTSAGAAGIWFDGNAVYDIDGQFISDLADIYDDPTWKLYDEDGNVLSTDTSEKFNDLVTGAPQADADAGPVNLCVYGEIEWADGGGPIPATVEIPVTPIMADTHKQGAFRSHPRRCSH